ncbi:rhamnogalacturonidase [Undibacterium sp. Ji50W]|uniref:rhamnogalacturonidase n=1 Tax=Undibacterium sp. Ji50W TaxID=3413041 RepID=UPI003BF2D224
MTTALATRRHFLVSTIAFAGVLPALSVTGALAAPVIPSVNLFDVKRFGAKGNGSVVDTPAINAAIVAASKAGGGTIYFPPGRYLSASIRLKSNITLYLEAGAVIEAADWKVAPYDVPEPNEAGGKFQDGGHSHWQNSLIWGVDLDNVAILGSGLIHGKGLYSGHNRATGGYQDSTDQPGVGNKAIGLRECRNVILRDFSILHGGHFGILATGCSNMLIDNLKIDSNRDGMDIDACNNVRISRCSLNTPWDDAIVLKASYGLGRLQACENITISDCMVSGNFDEGSMLDGSFKRSVPDYKSGKYGRIKLGTESNGDFKNITITNCIFDECRGLAIESVDGSHIEDITISNITMRNVANDPIFIRLGARLRAPGKPVVGTIKRINISNIVVSGAHGDYASTITGLPGHAVEDIQISNVQIETQGGGDAAWSALVPPENAKNYPEPGMFGKPPAYAFFLRHVKSVDMHHVKVGYTSPEGRTAIVLDDVSDAYFSALNLQRGQGDAALFDLRGVTDFSAKDIRGMADRVLPQQVTALKL